MYSSSLAVYVYVPGSSSSSSSGGTSGISSRPLRLCPKCVRPNSASSSFKSNIDVLGARFMRSSVKRFSILSSSEILGLYSPNRRSTNDDDLCRRSYSGSSLARRCCSDADLASAGRPTAPLVLVPMAWFLLWDTRSSKVLRLVMSDSNRFRRCCARYCPTRLSSASCRLPFLGLGPVTPAARKPERSCASCEPPVPFFDAAIHLGAWRVAGPKKKNGGPPAHHVLLRGRCLGGRRPRGLGSCLFVSTLSMSEGSTYS